MSVKCNETKTKTKEGWQYKNAATEVSTQWTKGLASTMEPTTDCSLVFMLLCSLLYPRPGLIRPCLGTAKVKFKSMMAWKVSKYLAHSIYTMYLQLVYNYTHLSLPPPHSLSPSLSSCLCVLKGSWPSADLRWYFSQSFCRPIEAVWALLMHRIGWELKASSGAWGITEPIQGKQTCSAQCKL